MIDCFLGNAFGALSCRFLVKFRSGCSAADAHLKLLDREVSGGLFNWGVFEGDFANRRSVPVLCSGIRCMCNPMHNFYGTLPMPHAPVQATRGSLVTHRHTLRRLAAEPRSISGLLFSSQ